MERKKNDSPAAAWERPYPEDPLENWDGQDSSRPEEPWEPDAIDLLLHPELAEEDAEDPEEEDGPERRRAAFGSATLRSPPPPVAAPDPGPTPHPAPAKSWGTGLYYPSGAEIPPTHPDHGPMHLLPRQENGGFSAYYYCSKAELAAMGIDSPPPRRHRRDGFHPERQEQFIQALRDTASFTDAARIVGISRSTAYNLYNNPDALAFRAAVDEALKGTEIILEATALDRAVKGNEEIVYYQGRRIGVRWKADNKLLMFMLRARNPLKYAPLSEIEGWLKSRGIERPPDLPAALDRLHLAEAEWGRRLPGEGEPRQFLAGAETRPAEEAGEGPAGPALPGPEVEPEAAPPASASPASAEPPSEDAAIAATSSISPDSGQAADPALASTSSDSGQSDGRAAVPAAPAAPDPGSGVRIYHPPLAGRFRAAGDGGG